MGVSKPESPEPEPPETPDSDADEETLAEYREQLNEYNTILAEMRPADRAIYDEALAEWEEKMQVYRRVAELDIEDLLDYLFLSVAERRASDIETTALIEIIDASGYLKTIDNEKFILEWYRDDIARLVLDYISRLPEIYYQKTFAEGV